MDISPLPTQEDGNDLELCLAKDLGMFRDMMRIACRSVPQFESEYPRVWKLEFNLLGEDEDLDWKLTLESDDEMVILHWLAGQDEPTVEFKEYPPRPVVDED